MQKALKITLDRVEFSCPKCGGVVREARNTRSAEYRSLLAVHRRRICGDCGHRISTVEVALDEMEELFK